VGAAVIDLGLDREPPGLDLPGRVRLRGRRLRAAAFVVAAALGLTAASVPAPPPPEVRIGAGLSDRVTISADRLYLIPSDTTWSAGTRTISAYELPTGRRLWRQPLPVVGRVRQAVAAPGALLVVVERDAARQTVAIDASSGRVRWRLAYQPVGLAAGGRLLLGLAPPTAADRNGERVVAIELATGRPAWTYDVPANAWHDIEWSAGRWVADHGADSGPRAVTAWPSGHVEVRDLQTGRVVAEAALGGPRSGNPWFQIAGDQLLAAVLVDGVDVVTAYRLPALERQWTVSLGLAGGYVSTNCGGALCFFSRGGGLRVIDPATGVTRWTDQRWQTVETVRGRMLAHAWPSSRWRSTTAVLDPATGRELLDLGRWTILAPVAPGGPARAVRLDPATGKAWFAVVDVEALAVRVLFSADGIAGDCQAGDRVVVCRRLDSSFAVWRFS
jgi:outer membrane protein assembly factor BamB